MSEDIDLAAIVDIARQIIAIADGIDLFRDQYGRDPNDDELADISEAARRPPRLPH